MQEIAESLHLVKISIVVADIWQAPQTTAATTDAVCLLQSSKVVRRIEEVHIERPSHHLSNGLLKIPSHQMDSDKRTIQSNSVHGTSKV